MAEQKGVRPRHFLDLDCIDRADRRFMLESVGRMKRGAVFVNVARGKVVDTSALVDALESGHLHGTGLDWRAG